MSMTLYKSGNPQLESSLSSFFATLREVLTLLSRKQGLRLSLKLRLASGFSYKNIRFRGINRYRYLFHGQTFLREKTLLL
jgi:hypothetical protein